MELAMRVGDVVIGGHARDFGHCLDLFGIGSCHAALAPLTFSLAGARLCPEPGMAM